MKFGRALLVTALLSVLPGAVLAALSIDELDANAYGAAALLWAVLFVVISVIYRPVEQLLSRTIADRRARGHHGRHPLRIPLLVQTGFAAAFLVVQPIFMTIGWHPLQVAIRTPSPLVGAWHLDATHPASGAFIDPEGLPITDLYVAPSSRAYTLGRRPGEGDQAAAGWC